MNQEENVYKETTQTEEAKTMNTGAEESVLPENTSTVLGKFKSVDALAQAYHALQAEFTRRSQRLKKLERETENLKAKSGNAEDLGVEKLRKNAEVKRAENKRFDEFVADVVAENRAEKPVLIATENVWAHDGERAVSEKEKAVFAEENTPIGEELAGAEKTEVAEDIAVTDVESAEKAAEIAKATKDGEERNVKMANEIENVRIASGEGKGMSVAEKDNAVLSSESLYERAVDDEKVRLRIIGEYLASIGRSGAPVTCGNTGVFSAPPLRAKSIADAGGMALHYFKHKSDGEK